jgi:hypothetical protein
MSPKAPQDRRRALKTGEQRVTILGVEAVVQFNDRVLVRDILDVFDRIKKLQADGADAVEATRLSLDLIDEADAIVTRAVGKAAREKMWSGSPLREPMVALVALVGPAGTAYDELFADYLPG